MTRRRLKDSRVKISLSGWKTIFPYPVLHGLVLCSQFLDLIMVFPAISMLNVFSYGHISTHLTQSMHPETVMSPPFWEYTSVTWVGQTLLHTPHFVQVSAFF
jgi:hypothetical protein